MVTNQLEGQESFREGKADRGIKKKTKKNKTKQKKRKGWDGGGKHEYAITTIICHVYSTATRPRVREAKAL